MTISASGDLDPSSKLFSTGDVDKVVYVPTSAAAKTRQAVGRVALVVEAGSTVELDLVLDDLGKRGVRRLMVEAVEPCTRSSCRPDSPTRSSW